MEQEDEWPTAWRAVQSRLRGERGLVTVSGAAALRGLGVAGAGCQECLICASAGRRLGLRTP